MNSYQRLLSITIRGVLNYLNNKPLCISFEITHDCNANCRHCHRGGIVDKKRATPQRFGQIYREFKSPVIQISGGEPLLRKDVQHVIEALKQPDGSPYIIFVTNGSLLTEEKYHTLRRIGVDVYSISLDYPDERHDEFRNIPGLFNHLETLIKRVDTAKNKAITFNSVIHSKNFRDLPRMAELAREWGVTINFSPYTWLRTNDKSFLFSQEELPELKAIFEKLIDMKKKYNTIRTTDSFFYDMIEFFKNESIPNCRAGERFLVVNPDGTLSPCGLIIKDYHSWKELKEKFTKHNTCTYCHTCIRSSTEKPINNLIKVGLQSLFAR